ncbi:MAG: cupredoxin domain-containing protein, partial [Candidatus Micrarchaeota archaeon]|nr:cupredoxin domain-containing protein [Candidatus Micrarchaeota archaeon]
LAIGGVLALSAMAAPAAGGPVSPAPTGSSGAVQDVFIRALPTGFYDQLEVTVKKGVPVRFHFTAEPGSGCGAQLIMDAFGVNLVSRGQETVAEFTPTRAGTYPYHCSMNMFRGKMVVE